MKDYYEILEVSSSASSEVIEKAYKALVKKYHPDLQPNDKKQEAEDKIKIINEAYDVLSNEEKKKEYDIKLKNQKLREEEQKYNNMRNNSRNGSSNYRNNSQNNSNNYKNNAYNNYSNHRNSAYNTQNNSSNNSNTAYNNNSNYQRQSNTRNPNVNNNKPKSSMQKRVISRPHNFGANNYNDFDLQNEFSQNINDIYRNAYNDAYNNAYINNLRNMGYQIHYEKTFGEKIRTFFAVILSIIFLSILGFILWHIPPVRSKFIDIYNSNDIFKLLVDIIINIFRSFLSLFS